MSRYLPTLRGWAALVLPVVGGFILLAIFPMRYIESGVGTWIMEPVRPSAWILGGAFVVLSVAACIEVLRRGSRVDRIVLCFGVLLTFWFTRAFFAFMLYPVRSSPI